MSPLMKMCPESLHRLIFQTDKKDSGYRILQPRAGELLSGLRELKGVVSAELI